MQASLNMENVLKARGMIYVNLAIAQGGETSACSALHKSQEPEFGSQEAGVTRTLGRTDRGAGVNFSEGSGQA